MLRATGRELLPLRVSCESPGLRPPGPSPPTLSSEVALSPRCVCFLAFLCLTTWLEAQHVAWPPLGNLM